MQSVKIDKRGLLELSRNLAGNMQQIKLLVDELENQNSLLIDALGQNDYRVIQNKVKAMQTEYEMAYGNLTTMLEGLEEYIDRVGEIRLLINPDGNIQRA